VHDTTIPSRLLNPLMQTRHGTEYIPATAENLANDYAITRTDQDAFALRSQQRAAAAQSSGRLAAEIVPVTVDLGRGKTATVAADEHPRGDTTAADLARLRPITRPGGTVTAAPACWRSRHGCATPPPSAARRRRRG
jgi:acetyl-CoA acetyltransferase